VPQAVEDEGRGEEVEKRRRIENPFHPSPLSPQKGHDHHSLGPAGDKEHHGLADHLEPQELNPDEGIEREDEKDRIEGPFCLLEDEGEQIPGHDEAHGDHYGELGAPVGGQVEKDVRQAEGGDPKGEFVLPPLVWCVHKEVFSFASLKGIGRDCCETRELVL